MEVRVDQRVHGRAATVVVAVDQKILHLTKKRFSLIIGIITVMLQLSVDVVHSIHRTITQGVKCNLTQG